MVNSLYACDHLLGLWPRSDDYQSVGPVIYQGSAMNEAGLLAERGFHTRFSYSGGWFTASGTLIAVILFGAGAWILLTRPGSEHFSGYFLVGGSIFFGILLTNAAFGGSDIIISETGLTWSIWRWQWRTIRWESIKSVRTGSFYDFDKKSACNKYIIELNSNKMVKILAFNDSIENAAQLKKIIEFYADKFQFEYNFPPTEPTASKLVI